MNSEISTDASRPARVAPAVADPGFQVWQLFTLAGLITASIGAFYATSSPPSVRVALILTVFGAAAMGAAATRTFSPLTGKGGPLAPTVVGGRTRAALERDKALVLRSLKELEFDRAMGKVSDKDYSDMSARLRGRAARILRQLDAGTGYRDAIEQEVAKRVIAAGPIPEPAAVSTPEPGDATRTTSLTPVTTTACDGCGTANDVDARFCKSCGQRLSPS